MNRDQSGNPLQCPQEWWWLQSRQIDHEADPEDDGDDPWRHWQDENGGEA